MLAEWCVQSEFSTILVAFKHIQIGVSDMSTPNADAPFLRRVLIVLVMATVLSGTISGVGAFRVSQATAAASTIAEAK